MPGAGDLRHRVAFDLRVNVDDGAGNTKGAWQEQFSRRAAFTYAGGSESVMAAQLEGRGVMRVRVRSCLQTRTIRQDWRMRDTRTGSFVDGVWTGTSYNVKEADTETDRLWVYLVVERGSVA